MDRAASTILEDTPRLIGVSYEELARVPPAETFAAIINTDKIDQPGTHWVACVIDDGVCYFYNSLGDKPNPLMVRELKRIGNAHTFYYWDTQQQPVDSFKCGYYCLNFLRGFAQGKRGIDLYTDLGLTDEELEANDKKMRGVAESS